MRLAYIFKSPDMDFLVHQGRLKSDQFEIAVCAARSAEEAVIVAQELLTRQVDALELSGGFSEADAEQVREALGQRIPVGLVSYPVPALQQRVAG
jgi:hypothetical protein